MANEVISSFVSSWPNQPHIEGGCFLPNDNGTRTPYPETPPQFVLDIVKESPRVVQLYWVEGKCWSDGEQPVALHVCQESRETALKVYKLAFKSELSPATTYFDYNVDILYLAVGKIPDFALELVRILRGGISRCDLDLVQHVAVDNVFLSPILWKSSSDTPSKDDHAFLSSLFPALRSLTSVVIPSASLPLDSFVALGFIDYSMDIIISSFKETGREFLPWMVENNGIVMPWKVPLGRATWEARISEIWRFIELHDPTVATLRIVAVGKLERDPKWEFRNKYLNGFIYFEDINCLLYATEELERLLELRDHEYGTYYKFGSWLAQSFYHSKTFARLRMIDEEAHVDPIEVYQWKRSCECKCTHTRLVVNPCEEYEELGSFEIDEGFDIGDEMRKCLLLKHGSFEPRRTEMLSGNRNGLLCRF
ncbi:uncharacterized protein EAE97_010708 [Botrytis byssoidea]|uniref:2EXR domain-containing protein n=1 Tax=Botrytis byssoidea TaxID=139641 RepID=A0A9P5HY16_9HELO|nr:uncharacterized protein EAE97_010708 [Botrytis byssoidea]KAF7924096.1 hypothetical protein EAE97_010708 [Botrytis byssoidea]